MVAHRTDARPAVPGSVPDSCESRTSLIVAGLISDHLNDDAAESMFIRPALDAGNIANVALAPFPRVRVPTNETTGNGSVRKGKRPPELISHGPGASFADIIRIAFLARNRFVTDGAAASVHGACSCVDGGLCHYAWISVRIVDAGYSESASERTVTHIDAPAIPASALTTGLDRQ